MQIQNVRTTTYLPYNLIQLAKAEALAEGTSVTTLVREGLELKLGLKKKSKKKLVLKSFDLGGAQVDRSRLYDEGIKHRVPGY